MNVQSQNAIATKRRGGKRRGNGEVGDAQHDADVIRMVSAEIEKRTAALHAMISDAAYFRAARRGFVAGHELDDWLAAEAEIAELCQQRALPTDSPQSRNGS